MSFIIREKWVWIIIGACLLIMIGPWVIMWVILQLPDFLKLTTIFLLLFSWAIVAGYKDWLVDRRKKEKLLTPTTD